MLIIYDSRAGKVKKFVEKLGMDANQLTDKLEVHEPFVFITYTDGRGQVPETSRRFLARCGEHLQGVAASGNKVFEHFAASADIIAAQYGVPVIHKFEMTGFNRDIETFRKWVIEYETHFVK